MTQPATVPEPSMEEILASIRRIIADDDAKPAAAEKAATSDAAVAKPQAVPPASKPAPAKPVAMTGAPAPVIAPKPAASAAPAPAASNSQDAIDAMLASLDAATTADAVRPAQAVEAFELTDELAPPAPAQAACPNVEPQD